MTTISAGFDGTSETGTSTLTSGTTTGAAIGTSAAFGISAGALTGMGLPSSVGVGEGRQAPPKTPKPAEKPMTMPRTNEGMENLFTAALCRVPSSAYRPADPLTMSAMAAIDRVMLRIERFIWFLIAAAVGGIWAFYEPLTGKDIPGHAHPVLATLLAAALTFGGIDLRKVARIRQELERVTNQAGLPPDAIADVAARIAILEVQDPQVARALRALAPPRTRRPTTNPARRPRRSTLDPDDGDEDT